MIVPEIYETERVKAVRITAEVLIKLLKPYDEPLSKQYALLENPPPLNAKMQAAITGLPLGNTGDQEKVDGGLDKVGEP